MHCMTNYKLGDTIAIEDLNDSDDECTAKTSGAGFDAFCNLNPGHAGPHAAANLELIVVAAWS